MSTSKATTRREATKAKAAPRKKRTCIPNKVVQDPGIKCVHCDERYGHKVTNTYPNGRKRRICGGCGKPFVSVRQ